MKHAKRRHTGAFHDDGFIKRDSTGKAPPQISAVFFDSVVIAKDHEETAKNYTKVRKIEENFINYSCRKKCILIAGHTHKPALMKTADSVTIFMPWETGLP